MLAVDEKTNNVVKFDGSSRADIDKEYTALSCDFKTFRHFITDLLCGRHDFMGDTFKALCVPARPPSVARRRQDVQSLHEYNVLFRVVENYVLIGAIIVGPGPMVLGSILILNDSQNLLIGGWEYPGGLKLDEFETVSVQPRDGKLLEFSRK
jgi:hypothetical protein